MTTLKVYNPKKKNCNKCCENLTDFVTSTWKIYRK